MTRRIARAVITLALAGGLPGVWAGGCAHGDLPPPASPPADYQVGVDDVLDVSVWKEPALSSAVPIRPDGKISLPLAGELAAAGHTTAELKATITERLGPFVPNPIVSVAVKEVHAARFYVLGEVAHPGVYPLTGSLTVLEAVAVAGGPTEFAHTGHIVLIRRGRASEKAVRIRVNLDEVVGGKTPPAQLSAGDTLYVP
jgi:polysaccharide export outer membrane protein